MGNEYIPISSALLSIAPPSVLAGRCVHQAHVIALRSRYRLDWSQTTLTPLLRPWPEPSEARLFHVPEQVEKYRDSAT